MVLRFESVFVSFWVSTIGVVIDSRFVTHLPGEGLWILTTQASKQQRGPPNEHYLGLAGPEPECYAK